MKKQFSGYYSPSKEDFSKLWKDCVFIFDANVLLNLYRYTASTANELIVILGKLSNRIWLPYQAALEYQKDRLNVISQQSEAYEKIQEWLQDVQRKLENQLRSYGKHPLIDVEKMIKKISHLFNAFEKELNKNKQQHPDLIHSDALRNIITSLFDGKVGPPYSEDELEQMYKKGEKRYRQSIPPGFSDANKEGTQKYSDLVLWFQVIDKAKKIKKPIIFVTDEKKVDWWYKFKGETIGPHPKLIEEIKSEANVLFYMYHTDPFMKHVQDYLKQKVRQKAIEEVREVQKSLEEQNVFQEVSKALGQMVNELDSRRDVLATSRPLSDVNVRGLDHNSTQDTRIQAIIDEILSTLSPREEKVLRMRFGIGEKYDHTLEEVGQDFGVTRERIRQIEQKALRKLRHPTRAKKLKNSLET